MTNRSAGPGREQRRPNQRGEEAVASKSANPRPASAASLWRAVRDLPGAGGRASLVRQARSLQVVRGNQHVQRLVQRVAATKAVQSREVARRAAVQRKGAKVTLPDPKDVDHDTYEIKSKTLEGVMYRLETGGEAGKGGIENPAIEGVIENGVAVEVTVTGRFLTLLPVWTARDSRPAAEQREWDRFLGVLTKHENKHLAIAQTHVKGMKSLGGLKEDDFSTKRDQKLQALEDAQKAYDASSGHGIKEGTVINLPDQP